MKPKIKKGLEDLVGDPEDLLVMLFLWTFLNLPWVAVGTTLLIFVMVM